MMSDGMMGGGMMGGGMTAVALYLLLWGLLAIALLVLAVVATMWLLRSMRNTAGKTSALERLDEGYATGELSREDYLQRRQDLTSA